MVHTPFRKSWECDMSTRIRLNLKHETKVIRNTERQDRAAGRDGLLRFQLLLQPHAGVQIQVVRGFVQ